MSKSALSCSTSARASCNLMSIVAFESPDLPCSQYSTVIGMQCACKVHWMFQGVLDIPRCVANCLLEMID